MTYPTLSMIDVIRMGASKRRIPAPCPSCGTDAPLASRDIRWDKFFIRCENESCLIPHFAIGDTLEEAWANWNSSASVGYCEICGPEADVPVGHLGPHC